MHDTLRWHLSFWEDTRASEFALSVIRNEYFPQLAENPEKYGEPNNVSYRNKRE